MRSPDQTSQPSFLSKLFNKLKSAFLNIIAFLGFVIFGYTKTQKQTQNDNSFLVANDDSSSRAHLNSDAELTRANDVASLQVTPINSHTNLFLPLNEGDEHSEVSENTVINQSLQDKPNCSNAFIIMGVASIVIGFYFSTASLLSEINYVNSFHPN